MSDSTSTSEWARRVHKLCDEMRSEEFLTPGEIRYFDKLGEFKASRSKCVDDAKELLRSLQEKRFGSEATSTVNDTVHAIKEYIVDVTEQIDVALDRHKEALGPGTGQEKVHIIPAATCNAQRCHQPAPSRPPDGSLRPQDSFYPPVDNSNTPFRPDFSHLKDVASDLPSSSDEQPDGKTKIQERAVEQRAKDKLERHAAQLHPHHTTYTYTHPFATALDNLPGQYPAWMLQPPRVIPPSPIGTCPFNYVDTTAALLEMAKSLSSVREFAIDLEHSDRSFQGFTCLMQISTRSHDYVVDTLALRSHLGAVLAAPFSDTSVLKVLHGADRDVMWLQKDFGLFLVNMFDTGQAARLLELPCGLGKLLNHFCQVSTDKSFQMADWRRRPLPDAMLQYARTDTHYLLYIADMLRRKLLEAGDHIPPSMRAPLPVSGPQGALGMCLERSRALTLERYEKPLFSPRDYVQFYRDASVHLNTQQLAALAVLYAWRDRTCRTLDEGIGRVLPKRLLIMLAQRLPEDPATVLRLAGRHKMLKHYAHEIADLISECLKQPVDAQQANISAEAGAPLSTPEVKLQQDGISSGNPGDGVDSLLVEDASDSSKSTSVDEEVVETVRTDPSDAAQRPRTDPNAMAAASAVPSDSVAVEQVSFAEMSAKPIAEMGNSVIAEHGCASAASLPARLAAGATVTSEEDDGAVEEVSFAALPLKPVAVACNSGMGVAPMHADVASPAAPTTAKAVQASQTRSAGVSMPPASSTMAELFAEPIQRQPITVRRPSGGPTSGSVQALLAGGASMPVMTLLSEAAPAGDAGDLVADENSGKGSAGTDGSGPRDKRAEVAAVADALRMEAIASAEAQAGDELEVAGGEGLTSVLERFGRKRRAETALLGDLTAIDFKSSSKARIGRLRSQREEGDKEHFKRQGGGDDDSMMFDYEAVLDGSDRMPSREGRGRGGRGDRGGRRGRGDRGRGGRGMQGRRQVRGDEHKSSKRAGIFEGRRSSSWNPYAVEAAETLGKRSGGSAPRTGNKSSNFRS